MSEQIDQQNNAAEQPSMFQVVNEGFTTREAIEEAKRCLHCKIPQCKKGCPIENDIPDFVHELSMGNMGAAMSIINAKSNLPAICGRVCPHEKQCQGNCVLGKKGKPVQIGKLEQFIADFDTKMNLSREMLPQKTRGRVAVIGSGPAGLTVAGDLARQGFNVTIFEGQAEPGGVLMYGIPEYRLPKSVVRDEVAKIAALGVQFITNCMVGENNVTIDSLFRAGYDAIFMGTGTNVPQNMDSTPGSKLHGVSQSTYFLHNVNAYNEGALPRDMVPLRDGEIDSVEFFYPFTLRSVQHTASQTAVFALQKGLDGSFPLKFHAFLHSIFIFALDGRHLFLGLMVQHSYIGTQTDSSTGSIHGHVSAANDTHLLAVAQWNHVAGQRAFVIGIHVMQKVCTLAHTVEL